MNDIRRRALATVARDALLSWQTLFTAGLTAGLMLAVPEPFPFWQPWFWLVGGVAVEAAWILSSVSDPNMVSEALGRSMERQYDLRKIENRVSRERLKSAIEYRRSMMQLANDGRGAMRTQLRQTVDDVDDWIAHMYQLARHIDGFESNELVERDRRMVPQQLDNARKRLELEKDEAVREELRRQIEQLEQQRQNLDATVNSIKRAEIQLESTLSSLGTVYAQMSRLGAKDVDSSRAQRLRAEIKDEVTNLQDTIDALDEVQMQRLTVS